MYTEAAWMLALFLSAFLFVVGLAILAATRPGRRESSDTASLNTRIRRSPAGFLVVVLVALLPLVAVGVLSAEPGTSSHALFAITLTPQQPVAIIDTEVRLSGGNPDLGATFSTSSRGCTVLLDAENSPSEYSPTECGPFDVLDPCTDCTYVFRTAFRADPSLEEPSDQTVETRFRWMVTDEVGGYGLPKMRMRMHLADVETARIVSNQIDETTDWTPSHPFDLRLITVHISDGLISETGLEHWPALEDSYTTIEAHDEHGTLLRTFYPKAALDPECPTGGCTDISYVVPIIAEWQTDVAPARVDLHTQHWVDLFDTASRRTGSIELTSEAPEDWITGSAAGEIELPGQATHTATFTISVAGTSSDDVGFGIVVLTAHADSAILNDGGSLVSEIRRIEHLDGCEHPAECPIVMQVDGDAGDVVSWTVEYHHGLFDSTAPPDARIVIEGPDVTTP